MSKKKVLLLGSGMCSAPIIKYLDKHGIDLTVGSRSKGDSKVAGTGAKWVELDIEKEAGQKLLDELAPQQDMLISLLPWKFHPKVAEYALKHNKHFLTASYVSDGIRALQDEFKKKGLVLINEVGVDPGTDHASMCEVVNRVHKNGGKITYFTSFAGGLCAPETDNNPFRYKFSWAPKGVLLLGKNNATFYRDGNEETIEGKDLFDSYWTSFVEPFGEFEAYPNRNSVPYREIYNIPECKTLIRGTLRYPGWCEKMKKFAELGYIDETPREGLSGKSFGQLTQELIKAESKDNLAKAVAKFLKVEEDSHVIKAYEWLGLFDYNEIIPDNVPTTVDALSTLMMKKMTLPADERDLMLLRHTFVAEYPDGKVEHITSTLCDYGIPNGDTSMARTTSLPLGICARMVLEGRYTKPGLSIPVTPDLYEPMMAELAELGIAYVEKVRVERKAHFWVRDEVKPGERRAPITPDQARRLLQENKMVTVERSTTRCFSDAQYEAVGCTMADSGSWKNAPEYATILGLKELPADGSKLKHAHIFFCHAYKNQAGWKEELARFDGGRLYDMEYLTQQGRRVAAFGRAAGLAGAAAAVLLWTAKQEGKEMQPLTPWKTQLHMVAQLKEALGNRKPKALVLGALGRSGRGAADVLDACGVELTLWDLEETKVGGPFPQLLDYDILVNCILLQTKIPPFLTSEMISKSGIKLSVIVDISCDNSNPDNPLPFLNKNTTLDKPVFKINDQVSAVTIDHLPTILPAESSEMFGADLLPHLLTYPNGDVWKRALKLFEEKKEQSKK